MSMVPFFPSLRPQIANRIWFDITAPTNEEAFVFGLERKYHTWLESFKTTASDIQPLGKVLIVPGPESDEDDANDDSDDSDSRDDEDEDTNDRPIPNQPERTAMGLYSPGDEILNDLNEEVSVNVGAAAGVTVALT